MKPPMSPSGTLPLARFLVVLTAALVASCATTGTRIERNEELFNSYTAEERRLIRSGEVAVGFDEDQVRMALGPPSRVTSRTTSAGRETVWEYRELDPGVRVSAGANTRHGPVAGVGVRADPDRTRLLQRIRFDPNSGTVAKIETFK